MAPVLWGLDLGEIKWSKFKSSYMWNNEYYLRRTKFIVYQCALIFCVVSESLGTAVLSDYTQGQRRIHGLASGKVTVSNNDYVGAASYNIFAGVYIAFVFGAAFFFDLIWPERREDKGIRIAWKACAVMAVIFHFADALALTIITATHRSRVQGAIAPFGEEFWWDKFSKHNEAPLIYRHNARAIAAVVFVWLGFCSVVPSCVLLFLGIRHVEKGLGAKSKHARERDAIDEEKNEAVPASPDHAEPAVKDSSDSEKAVELPDSEVSSSARHENTHADGQMRTSPAAETT